jgi:hypothetical protein
MARIRQASLSSITNRLTANTNRIAFSSTRAFNFSRGTMLSVPNAGQSGLLPAFLNSYIIHNRAGNVLGYDLQQNLQWEKDQLNSTIKR